MTTKEIKSMSAKELLSALVGRVVQDTKSFRCPKSRAREEAEILQELAFRCGETLTGSDVEDILE